MEASFSTRYSDRAAGFEAAARLREWIEAHTHEPTGVALADLRVLTTLSNEGHEQLVSLKQSLDTYKAALSGTQHVRDDYKASVAALADALREIIDHGNSADGAGFIASVARSALAAAGVPG